MHSKMNPTLPEHVRVYFKVDCACKWKPTGHSALSECDMHFDHIENFASIAVLHCNNTIRLQAFQCAVAAC